MTNDSTNLVRLSVRRTGNTPAGHGIYEFDAVPVAAQLETTPWRCASCRWWEVIPEFAIDPSGGHGMCLLAELQDASAAEPAGPVTCHRCLADDGMATTADFGCVSWQTATVPVAAPWLQGADEQSWQFPGVASGHREPTLLPNGQLRPGGPVTTFAPPEPGDAAAAPAWACRSCRWHRTSTAAGPRGGACSIVAKADLIPAGDDPCVFLKAFAGEDGLATAPDFGCAMWDDERYSVLPERRWYDEA